MSATPDDIYADLDARASVPQAAPSDLYADLDARGTGTWQPPSQPPSKPGLWADTKFQAGLAGRNVIEGVTGLVTGPLDLIGKGLNAVGDKNTYNFGGAVDQGLTKLGLPQPQTPLERWAGLGQQVVTGAALGGVPSLLRAAPEVSAATEDVHPLAEAATAETQRLADITQRGQDAGLDLPVGGTPAQHAAAAVTNQPVANALVRNELQLPTSAPLMPNMLKAARAQYASPAYQAIEKIPEINLGDADSPYHAALAEIDTDSIPAKLQPPAGATMSGEKAVDLSKSLRFRANQYDKQAQISGSPDASDLAETHRDAAQAIEDAVQQHLVANGQGQLAQDWDNARIYTAKTYSVQNALDGAGNVKVPALKQQLLKGRPLSGSLEDLANLGAQYPKAFTPTLMSAPAPGFIRKAGAAVAPYAGGLVGGGAGSMFGPAGAAVGAFGGKAVGEHIAGKILGQ